MQDIIQIVLKSFPIVLLSEEKCPDVLERVLTLLRIRSVCETLTLLQRRFLVSS